MISRNILKEGNFCDFLFASLGDKSDFKTGSTFFKKEKRIRFIVGPTEIKRKQGKNASREEYVVGNRRGVIKSHRAVCPDLDAFKLLKYAEWSPNL